MTAHRMRLPSTGRVEAFSDGVFAIAITLLVLDLRPPQQRGAFLHELTQEWQSYLAYLGAFLIIGTLWLTHHSLFDRIARVDGPLLAANLGVLLLASLLPFPTAVLSAAFRVGDHRDQTVGIVLYAVLSVALILIWYVLSGHLARTPGLPTITPTPRVSGRRGVGNSSA